MKVSAKFAVLGDLATVRKIKFEGPAVMSLCPTNQINDGWFAPIAGMYSQFETYSYRAERMFDELIKLGGADLVVEVLNIGQQLSPDLGWANDGYAFGLKSRFLVHDRGVNFSMVAVHFTDWVFQMAMDTSELGELDFEHAEFDELIQSLRDNTSSLYNATQG